MNPFRLLDDFMESIRARFVRELQELVRRMEINFELERLDVKGIRIIGEDGLLETPIKGRIKIVQNAEKLKEIRK